MHIAFLAEEDKHAHVQVGNQDLLFLRDTSNLLTRKTFWLEEPMEFQTSPVIHFITNSYGMPTTVIFTEGGRRRYTLMMGNSVCFTLEYNFRRRVLTLLRGSSIRF